MQLYLDVLILGILLLLSAIFAATEVAFLSISPVRLHSLVEKKVPGAESLHRLRSRRRKVIIALLIGNNVVNIAASAIATAVAIGIWGESGLGLAIAIMTFLILTFGDIVPKSFATSHAEKIMLIISPALEFYYYLVFPFVALFDLLNHLIPGVYSRPTGIEKFTEDEIRSAVKLGAKTKGITEKEKEMIENVLEFNDRTVAHAMTPKSKVVSIDGNMIVATAHKKVLENTQYSRFPVLQNGKVIGTVSVRMLGRALYQHPDWHVSKIAWEPIRFHPNVKVSEAFARLQKLGRNIAIVEDEKGRFLGIVTVEDLLEELVGEIK
ncbi:MAG: CNNM domain-containing protein [Candidatus Micrarchaeota archaeon]|nr:CNNM domain-containing protein [Candidatus Micrarchaeota archaeon]